MPEEYNEIDYVQRLTRERVALKALTFPYRYGTLEYSENMQKFSIEGRPIREVMDRIRAIDEELEALRKASATRMALQGGTVTGRMTSGARSNPPRPMPDAVAWDVQGAKLYEFKPGFGPTTAPSGPVLTHEEWKAAYQHHAPFKATITTTEHGTMEFEGVSFEGYESPVWEAAYDEAAQEHFYRTALAAMQKQRADATYNARLFWRLWLPCALAACAFSQTIEGLGTVGAALVSTWILGWVLYVYIVVYEETEPHKE